MWILWTAVREKASLEHFTILSAFEMFFMNIWTLLIVIKSVVNSAGFSTESSFAYSSPPSLPIFVS